MPLYEYHCETCGRFETLQKFSDGPLTACPTCEGAVERLISAPAFQFKGSGFYITDYVRSGEKGADSKDSDAKSPAAKSSDGADSKSSKSDTGSGSSKEALTPTSADSKSSTNSPPKESAASAAPAPAPAAPTSQ